MTDVLFEGYRKQLLLQRVLCLHHFAHLIALREVGILAVYMLTLFPLTIRAGDTPANASQRYSAHSKVDDRSGKK